ncbi:glycosyltransferase family 2 protein [Vallicoccus soli]|uniref:glycosyltransferase family 2 protein n=1 Tax=Vallicoccus soli TaxID=2339232 RepID=UPI00105A87D1|nr:glycosyltransferase [Vallicoccus soli]
MGVARVPAAARLVARTSLAVPEVVGSLLFDEGWYAAQSGLRLPTRAAAAAHWLARGRHAGHAPHPLLEPQWWDPRPGASRRRDPVTAYRRARTLRSPHPFFDTVRWVQEHPSATAHPDGPLGHWLAAAGPGTPLPTPALGGERAEITWAAARERLAALLAEHRALEAVRRAPRVSAAYDHAAERRALAALAAAPLPPAEPGRPLVSVVMPVRDRAGTVGAAVASVLAQTLRDWELVVVDDGSTDGSAHAAGRAAAGDGRVRVVRRAAGGVGAARNAGLALCRGTWVAWLDSDNAWRPEHLRACLAALVATGARAAYDDLAQHDGGRTTYRALDAGLDHLLAQNHVDLNVLVAERALVEEVGGFDTSLRRAVDYDLVLHLARRARIVHVPVVGADYEAGEGQGAARLTRTELPTWSAVVRRRHLVDADALRAGLAGRDPGVLSAVVPARDEPRAVHASVEAALDAAARPGEVEVVVVDAGSRRGPAMATRALAALSPRVRVLPWSVPMTPGLAVAHALAGTAGATVALLAPGDRPHHGWATALRERLGAGGPARAAAPVVLGPDGTVAAAGLEALPGGALAPALRGLPPDDATRAGSAPLAAAGASGLALRAGDLVPPDGVDPLHLDLDAAAVALTTGLAAADPGAVVLEPAALVTRAEPPAEDPAAPVPGAGAPPGRPEAPPPARAGAGAVRAGTAAARAGLRVVGHRRGADGGPEPVHAHAERDPARLRWAVKTGAPAGPASRRWGDVHFARSLGAALERLGQQVVVDGRHAAERPSAYLDDVVLVLRGLTRVRPPVDGVSLLWVISHPDLVEDDELREHDAVFAASAGWARRAGERAGREVGVLLQATDPARFHPGAGSPGTGDSVLFVGNSRGVRRPVVQALVDAGVDVAVHGAGWDRFLPPGRVRSGHVANDRLAGLYRSSGVVLNDHWPDMRREGFLSNRLFDAAASGARVVTDEVEGTEVFGGLVVPVDPEREPERLRALVADRAAFPDDAERAEAGRRLGREHSFDARARVLLDAALAARAARAAGAGPGAPR